MGFNQIPENWIGVIATVAGGLLVGVFALISKYVDKTSESKTITRNKLEELHLLLNSFMLIIDNVYDVAYRTDQDQIEPRTLAGQLKENLFVPMAKMSTLQNLYAPRTGEAFKELGDLAAEYVMAAIQFAGDASLDNARLDECHSKMLDATTLAMEEVENVMFRSNLIPNQTLLDRLKASWKYAGKRALGPSKSDKREL